MVSSIKESKAPSSLATSNDCFGFIVVKFAINVLRNAEVRDALARRYLKLVVNRVCALQVYDLLFVPNIVFLVVREQSSWQGVAVSTTHNFNFFSDADIDYRLLAR